MTVEFGWVVDEIVRSSALGSSVVIFAVLSPLDPRTDGGLGIMRNDSTYGQWHLHVGNLGSGHRRPPDVVIPRIYARLQWRDGSQELKPGDVLRAVAAATLPVKFVQSFPSEGQCPNCGAPVLRAHDVLVELGDLQHIVRMECKSCGHEAVDRSDDVEGTSLDAARREAARIALYLPSVRSDRMRREISRILRRKQDVGSVDPTEHPNAVFIGVPFQAMQFAQRLKLRRFEVGIHNC